MKLTFKQKLIVTAISTILSAQAYADCTPALTAGADGTTAAPVVCTGALGTHVYLDPANTTAEDTVTFDGANVKVDIMGDYLLGGNKTASDDTINFTNGSVSRYIYGDFFTGSNNKAGSDTINLKDSSLTVTFSGDYFIGGDNNQGADDIITFNNSKAKLTLGGNFTGDKNIGGNSTLNILNRSYVTRLKGGQYVNTTKSIGGNTTINLDDSESQIVIVGNEFTGANSSSNRSGSAKVTLNKSKTRDVYGAFFQRGGDNESIINNINISNGSKISKGLYGTFFGAGSNNKSEGSNISVKDSTVGLVYGSYFINNSDSNSGDNTITIENSTIKRELFGSWFHFHSTTGGNKEGKNTITVKNSSIGRLVGSDFNGGSKNIGGENIIKLTSGSTIGTFYGTFLSGVTDTTSAKNTITIDKSKVNSALFGNYFHLSSNKNKSGGSKITVKNSSVVSDVFSDYFSAGTDNIAGDDIINIEDSVARNIYGEYGAGKIISGGNDTLNLKKATVTGKIDMSVGDDTVNYFGNGNTIANDVDGGEGHDRFNVAEYQGKAVDLASNFISFEDFGLVQNTVVDFEDSYTSPKFDNYFIDETSTITMTGNGAGVYVIDANVDNKGTFDFEDGKVGDNLTVNGNLSGKGTYKFDVDFGTYKSDMITVTGDLTATDGVIDINDVTTRTFDKNSNSKVGLDEAAEAASKDILLVATTTDKNRGDDSYTLASNKFAGSPFVWDIKGKDEGWALTTTADKDKGTDKRPAMPTPSIPVSPSPSIPVSPSPSIPVSPSPSIPVSPSPSTPVSPSPTPTPTPATPTVTPTAKPKLEVIAEIPAYANLSNIVSQVSNHEMETLHTRLGELRNNSEGYAATDYDKQGWNAWGRFNNSRSEFKQGSNYKMTTSTTGFTIGADTDFNLSANWKGYAGGFVAHNLGETTTGRSDKYLADKAEVNHKSYSLGAYATFFHAGGTYLDFTTKYSAYDFNIHTADLSSPTDASSISASVEVGHSFKVTDKFIIEPQAQVTATRVSVDNIKGNGVSTADSKFDNQTFITGRLGVRAETTIKTSKGEFKPYAYLGAVKEFSDTPEFTYGNIKGIKGNDNGKTLGEVKLGFSAELSKSAQVYGELSHKNNFDDYEDTSVYLGVRIGF